MDSKDSLQAALEPCPFCGGEAAVGSVRYNPPLDPEHTRWVDGSAISVAYSVNCVSCGATNRSTVAGGYQTEAEAIAAWNRRASTDAAPVAEKGDFVEVWSGSEGSYRHVSGRVMETPLYAHPPVPDAAGEEQSWKTYYNKGEPDGFYITTSAAADGERTYRAGYRAALAQPPAAEPRKGDFRCHNCKRIVEGVAIAPKQCPDCRCSDFSPVAYSERKYAPAAEPVGMREALAMAQEVRDLLLERIQGSPARSAAHNARVRADSLIQLLSSMTPALATGNGGEGRS